MFKQKKTVLVGKVIPFYTKEERLVIKAIRDMDEEFLEDFWALTRYSFDGFCYFYYRLPEDGPILITEKHNALVERELNKRKLESKKNDS